MEIRFKDNKLRSLCEKQAVAVKQLGALGARKLRLRLTELRATEHVRALPVGKPHPLKGKRAGQLAISLHDGQRLVFSSAHIPCPELQDGSIDWQRVTIICIEYIGDYHD